MLERIVYSQLPEEIRNHYGNDKNVLKITKHKAVAKHMYLILIRDGSQDVWEYLKNEVIPRIGNPRPAGWNVCRIEPDRLKRK